MTSTWIIQATVALKNNQVLDGCILKDITLQTYGDVSYLNQLPKVNELFRQLGLTNGVVTELSSNVLDYTYRFNYIGANGHIDIVGDSNNLESPITDCVDSCDLIDDVDLVSTINNFYPQFILTVVGGTGSGIYSAGATINIISPPLENQLFSKWIVDSGDPVIGDINSDNTTIVMPASDVIIHRETPVEQTLELANLRSLALDCPFMFRPGYPGLDPTKTHYLYIPGQGWTAAYSTLTGTMSNTGVVTGGTFSYIAPTTVVETYTIKWSGTVCFCIGFDRALTAAERTALGQAAFWALLFAGTAIVVGDCTGESGEAITVDGTKITVDGGVVTASI